MSHFDNHKAYSFKTAFRDIDLSRISHDIGDAPYARVDCFDHPLVVAGAKALQRGFAVDTLAIEWGASWLKVNARGDIEPQMGGSIIHRCAPAWSGVNAIANATRWWKEVRFQEIARTATVIVTPAKPE